MKRDNYGIIGTSNIYVQYIINNVNNASEMAILGKMKKKMGFYRWYICDRKSISLSTSDSM